MEDRGREMDKRDYRIMLVCFVAAFGLRLAYLVAYSHSVYWDALVMDPANHWDIAGRIASGGEMGPYAYFRAPLYLWILAGMRALAGDTLWPIRIVQALMGSLTAALTYRLARYYTGRAASAHAGMLMALYWLALYFDGEILITCLATFLGLAALIATIGAWKQSATRTTLLPWVAAGLIIGLTAIARPNILVFGAAVFFVVLFFLPARQRSGGDVGEKKGRSIKRRAAAAVALAAGIAACVLPVTARNLIVAGDPVLISSQGGINFWLGNNASADGRTVVVPAHRRQVPVSFIRSRSDQPFIREDVWLSSAYLAEMDLRRRVTESEISDYWYDKAFEWMRDNPADAAVLLLKKTLYLFSATEVSNNRDLEYHSRSFPLLRALSILHFGVIMPFAAGGLAIFLVKRRDFFWPALYFACYSMTLVAFFVAARYRIPMMPVLMCAVALWAEETWAVFRRIRSGSGSPWPSAAVLVLVPAAMAVVSNVNWTRWNDRPLRSAMHYNLGIALAETGDYGESEKELEEALHIKDSFPEAWFWLGKVRERSGDMEGAASMYEKCLEQAPDYAPAHYELYRAYSQLARQGKEGMAEKARSHLEAAHNIEPDVFPAPGN